MPAEGGSLMAELTRERIAELRAQAKMYPYADMLIDTEKEAALWYLGAR